MEMYLNNNFNFVSMNKRGVRALYITGTLVVALVCLSIGTVILTGGEYLPQNVRDFFVNIGVLPPDVQIQINNYGFDCEGSDARFAVLVENTGGLPISGFVAVINSENGQQEIEKEQELLSNRETWVDFFGLDCTTGDFVDAVITPKIMVNGQSVVYNGSSTNTTSSGSSGGGGGGGGDDSGDDNPPFVWDTGRPACEYNCESNNLLLAPIVQDGEDPFGHNDFAFFQDHNAGYHLITIKSKKCTSDDDCDGECSSNYCRPDDTQSENEFVHYTSQNMVDWTRQPDLIHISDTGDDSLSVWAPHVYYNEDDGAYYLYYSGVSLEPCENGEPDCEYIVQRIMLAKNDGTDLNNPDNWVKQGVALECDALFSSWNDDDSSYSNPQWKKSCRDPMVMKYNETHWIMYVHSPLSIETFFGPRYGVTYGFSEDLETWEHYAYINDTRQTPGYCGEGPSVFEGDNGKYYLHHTCGTSHYGDEVIDNETILTTTTNFNNPTEFLYTNNPALEDGPFLVVASRINPSYDREIKFEIYDTDDGNNDLIYFTRPDGVRPFCFGCDPQPYLIDIGLTCGVSQDCALDMGCADYSGDPINDGNLCCDIVAPASAGEYCCLPTGETDILNNEVPICKDVCPVPDDERYNVCSEIDNHCKCDVVCPPRDVEYGCSTGLPGYCSTGSATCLDDGSGYGECIPYTQEGEYPEICEDSQGNDEDCDGLSNEDDPDCNPDNCNILSAYWGDDTADDYIVDGDQIILNVVGEGCDGMTLSLEYWEYDQYNDDDPITLSTPPYPLTPMFREGVATAYWRGEWFSDPDGEDIDPEIKFIAYLNLDLSNNETSADFVDIIQSP
jgi:hypothetical protein